MSNYTITALEYGECPGIASVCAVKGQVVYEDPNHAGIELGEAQEYAESIAGEISDDVIENKWVLLSV